VGKETEIEFRRWVFHDKVDGTATATTTSVEKKKQGKLTQQLHVLQRT
jgi:hypothetical protein